MSPKLNSEPIAAPARHKENPHLLSVRLELSAYKRSKQTSKSSQK